MVEAVVSTPAIIKKETKRYHCTFYRSKQADKYGKFNVISNYFDRFNPNNPDNGKLILLPIEFSDKIEFNKIYLVELEESHSKSSYKVVSMPVIANDLLELVINENTIDVLLNGEAIPYFSYIPSKTSDYLTPRDKMSSAFANWEIIMSKVAFTLFLNKFDAACHAMYKELKKNAKKSYKKDYEVDQKRPNQTPQLKLNQTPQFKPNLKS
jgi:hypothetical protein